MSNVVLYSNQMAAETRTWKRAVENAGGGFQWNSVAIADAFIKRFKIASYRTKVKYLLPLLGTGINAARVPLIDAFAVGAAANTSFVNADFNQSLGLQGNGSTKSLDTLIAPGTLGSSLVGGLGYWENGISFAGSDAIAFGCYDASNNIRANIDLRSASSRATWGLNTNSAINNSAAANGHYYGQAASNASRALYINAASVATNTTSDGNSFDSTTISLMGTVNNVAGNWAGRCAVAYLTDGTMTTNEISAFDTLLRAYLLGPCGKPQT